MPLTIFRLEKGNLAGKKMLTKRIITSAFLMLLIVLTLGIFPEWIFGLVVTLFIGISLYEFFVIVEGKGITAYKYPGIIMGILIPIVVFFKLEPLGDWVLLFIVSSCLCFFVLRFTRKDNSHALTDISVTMLGIIYISWFLSFLLKLKFEGVEFIIFLLLVTKMGDVGAFFLGNSFGKHTLIPRISPKKSVEGTVGGLLTSIIVALVSGRFLLETSIGHLLMLGILLGGLGQIGDLSESLIKRDCKVKDSGKLLPGLGGMLDLMDSLLFASPLFYFYIKVFL